ncbi:MAG TPA: hypothetical protein VIM01_01805 [Dermatophilaceae bacterium]
MQVGHAECTVELAATSDQLVIPALWQLPTMAVAMPAMTMLRGLAAVHWRADGHRPEAALVSGGRDQTPTITRPSRNGPQSRYRPLPSSRRAIADRSQVGHACAAA